MRRTITNVIELKEAIKSINHLMKSESKFAVGRHMFWAEESGNRGLCLDIEDHELVPWTVDTEHSIFDIWHDGHFVDHGEQYYHHWLMWVNRETEEIIELYHD